VCSTTPEAAAALREAHPTVITGRDLAATPPQLGVFARSWGHRLPRDRGDALHAQCGGHLGVLRCALDHAGTDGDPHGLRAAGDYLRRTVLAGIPGDRLAAMGALALAGRADDDLLRALFDPPVAPELPGPAGVRRLRADLRSAGLLVGDGGGARALRFPPLVGGILAQTLEGSRAELARAVHSALASWHAGRDPDDSVDDFGPAAVHARAAGDWDLLARTWNEWGLYLAIHQPRRCHAAYGALPDEAAAAHPELALAASVTAALGSDPDDTTFPSSVDADFESGWTLCPPSPQRWRHSTLEAAAHVITVRRGGDVEEARRFASSFARAAPDWGPSRASLANRSWFELQWALASHGSCRTVEAVALLEQSARHARAAGAGPVAAAAGEQIALMYAVAGYTRTAVEYLGAAGSRPRGSAVARLIEGILLLDRLDPRASDCFSIPGADDIEEWAVVAWARTQYAMLFGDPIVALAEVNRMAVRHLHTSRQRSANRSLVDRAVADLGLALGELNRAQRHLEECGSLENLFAVPRARLAYICGDHAKAGGIAAAHAWEPATTLRDRIELVMLRAAAALARKDAEGARLQFSRAHRLAAETGTLIPYTALPREACDRLLDLIGNPLAPSVVERIHEHRQPYPARGRLITLTPREKVVLGAMVEHETLADIAEELVLSLNTIKKQAHAVYAKLGVHDRQSALLVANRLGLLPDPAPDPSPAGRAEEGPRAPRPPSLPRTA
jgi:LuxR family maltose regulon positive regulatory protein